MKLLAFILASLVSFAAAAQYVPPVPIGVLKDGKPRNPASTIPFPSESREWLRVRSKHFDVISSAGAEKTTAIAADLEALGDALTSGAGAFDKAEHGGPRTTIFVFDTRSESQPYFDLLFDREDSRATGAYVRHDGGGTMFIDASRSRGIERTAMHELVHDILRRTDLMPPLWLEEGLAEYFAGAEIRDRVITAGQPIREQLAQLKRRTFPVAEMFAVKAESDAAGAPAFYAQSWAAVHWLMELDRAAFFPFLRDVNSGTSVADALRKHYDRTPPDMDAAIRRAEMPDALVTFAAGARAEVSSAPIDRASLLFELASFLGHVTGAEKEVSRHLAEALRVNPKHAATLAALGRFEEAVAAAPDDPAVHLRYAESLLSTATGEFAGIFEPSEGDAARFRKARTLAARALALGGDEGLASGLAGTSWLVESDLAPGIASLERSHALLPQRSDFALNLYAMYLRSGDRTKADALYAEAFERSPNKQVVFAAKNVLLTAETARANALTAKGKLSEAAAVVRELAAATPDDQARAELESQAAELESIAAVNRHITMYNEAVRLANLKLNADALRLLDKLLGIATDPQVVRDAKKLREEVRTR